VETLRVRYRDQPVNAVGETAAVYREDHAEHAGRAKGPGTSMLKQAVRSVTTGFQAIS
jgi:hypothetical protein